MIDRDPIAERNAAHVRNDEIAEAVRAGRGVVPVDERRRQRRLLTGAAVLYVVGLVLSHWH